MNAAQHLDALRQMMPPGVFRDAARQMLKGFQAADLIEWEKLQNARRVREHRAKSNGRKVDPTITETPVGNGSTEGATITETSACNEEVPPATITKEEKGFPSGLPSGKEEAPGKEEKTPLRGEKEKKTAPAELPCPTELDTTAFRAEFKRWMQFRRGLGKKPKDWAVMFEEQLRWLAPFGVTTATAILGQSIRNGYQGLFELKAPANGTNGHGNGSQPRAPTTHAPADVAAWIATRPEYAAKRAVWTTFDSLPAFARTEFLQHRKTTATP